MDFRQVSFQFPGAVRTTLGPLTFSIRTGDFVTFIGPSGCGKSTLLRIIAGLLMPSSGELKRAGSGPDDRSAADIGFVFQHPTLLPWRTAEANIRLPLELGRRSTAGRLPTSVEVHGLLKQVGLSPNDAAKRPRELSGGMQMRLSLARALATDPSLLLLDEPLAAVDDLLRQKLQEDLRRIHVERKLTTILVTHNLPEAVFLSDRVFVMGGTPATIRSETSIDTSRQRDDGFRTSAEFSERTRELAAMLHAC